VRPGRGQPGSVRERPPERRLDGYLQRSIVSLMSVFVISFAAVMAQQEATVSARVDATRIGEGDSVTLTIEVSGKISGHVEDPDLSGLADFTIATGPSVSTSTSMVWSGGRASSSTSQQYTYVLLPRRKGTLTIPTISVRIGSRLRQTNPLSVVVVEGRLRQSPSGPSRGVGPGFPGRRRGAEEPAGEILVESQADKREVFVGEQVLLTYKVYTQLDLTEVPVPQQLPSYTGFWVEEIPVDPRATIHRVEREGKDFLEFTLMKKALFPTSSGELSIEETVFGMNVKVPSRDPFDSIFFTPTRAVYRKTAPMTIKVKPLPEAGRPASFAGAVGRYTLSVQSDRAQTQVNEALSLKVAVKGTGNVRTISELTLPPLPDYKKYPPKLDEKKEIAKERLQGTKTWDYVLTPIAPGPQDIPPIRFSFFDPAKGTYVEVSSEPIPILVARGEGGGDAGAAGPGVGARREVTAFGRDVLYIKPVSDLALSPTPFHRSAAFVSLLAAPILANAGLLVMVKRRRALRANAVAVRGRRAPAFARRRLREARKLMGSGKSLEFHMAVARALSGYLGDKLNIPPSGLTHPSIDALLAERGAGEEARVEMLRCLDACDYARFAPVAPGPEEMSRLVEQAELAIGRVEAETPSRRASRRTGAWS